MTAIVLHTPWWDPQPSFLPPHDNRSDLKTNMSPLWFHGSGQNLPHFHMFCVPHTWALRIHGLHLVSHGLPHLLAYRFCLVNIYEINQWICVHTHPAGSSVTVQNLTWTWLYADEQSRGQSKVGDSGTISPPSFDSLHLNFLLLFTNFILAAPYYELMLHL